LTDPIVAPELMEFLGDEDEEAYDWAVEGLFERMDRLMITGPEGGGKSTLLRQWAVQFASGIHPFTLEDIDPVRVLLVDLENGKRHVRRELRKLKAAAGKRYSGMMFVEVNTAGMDLSRGFDDDLQLKEIIELRKPEILLIGPAYKMATGDPNKEETARAVQITLDKLRAAYGFVTVLETHTGHGTSNNPEKRPRRPVGASAWLRWPEFGLHLSDQGMLTHWRGQRDERQWPLSLKRGGTWPWTVVTAAGDINWAKVVEYAIKRNDRPSQRDIAEAIGMSQSTVKRTLEANQTEWNAM
jgi:RecA-family ATPase